MGARIERVTFAGSQGASWPPDSTSRPAHRRRSRCSRTASRAERTFTRRRGSRTRSPMSASGSLRFDFTGLGMSDGEFANTNFTSNTEDLVAASDWLRANHQAPQVLIGHSLGGSAVLAVAGSIAEARAVATIGAPSSPEHVTGVFAYVARRDRVVGSRRGAARRTDVHDPSAVRRRSAQPCGDRSGRHVEEGAVGAALAGRQHRRHRQRGGDLPGRPPSEELRVTRRRRPPAVGLLRCGVLPHR